MGKNPAFLFYPSDWTRDLDDQDLEVEGAWIRICCRLWWSEKRGEATKPMREWARILRKTEKKTKEIFQILIEKRIASGSILDNQNITIISRRIVRDYEISQIRKEVGKLGGNPKLKKINENLDNQSDNQKDRSSVSVSVSSSNPITEPNGSMSETEKTVSDGNGKYPPCPQTEIINLYHKTLPELPRVKHWPENLQVILRTRWKEDPVRQNLDWWEQYFRYVQESDFLMGRTKEAFVADLEWLVRPKNFTKIANGRYHGRSGLSAKPQPGISAWLEERNHATPG
ncbi:MAG: hypothetical protein PHU49_14565 [Syntrophorhabdaceae bacterium]|nr:hypothetical protein [Syntrophorhabdaceae bacterium]